MATLLSLVQQQQIKPISPNWAEASKSINGVTNYEQLAIEVEESDLQELLGVALLQDLQTNPTDAKYVTLLDGGTFEDCECNIIKFKGLRYVLAYMNYSQYVTESFGADTFTGFVKKERNEASSLSSSERKEIKQNVRLKAMVQWDLCKKFLNDNKEDYPLWNIIKSKVPYRPKVYGVRKTIRR